MPAVNFENRRSGCYLGQCASLNIVNEEIIVASGEGILYPGTVLGKITASGKYAAHTPGAADGSQTAAAILFHKIDATDEDVTTVGTVRGPATINGTMLTFADGISAANKSAAEDALRAAGMAVLPQHAA